MGSEAGHGERVHGTEAEGEDPGSSEDRTPPPAEPPTGSAGHGEASRTFYLRLALVLVAVYVAVSFAMSCLRFTGFFDENWDLGIMQQALWSTSHGHPMFEAGDYEELGVSSLFQVHPSLLVFALSIPYALAPSAFTLFLLQSLAVGAAGIPLYFLTRSVTSSSRKALVTVALFLTWLPLLSSQMYDFHLEAFLPIELFTTAYFWERRSYGLTLISSIVAMLTLEIAPLFVVAMAAFFGLPPLLPLFRDCFGGLGRPEKSTSSERRTGALTRLLTYLRQTEVLFALAMVNVAVGVYFLLRLLQGPYIGWILGPSVSPSGFLWGFTASSFGLSPAYLGAFLTMKVTYWATLYGLVLFLPFLRPRSLILVLPWLAFTFLSPSWGYVTIGYQYGLVAAFPVFAGVAYAMDLVPVMSFRHLLKELRSVLVGSVRSAGSSAYVGELRTRRPRLSTPAAGSLVLGTLIVVGLMLTPIAPWSLSSVIPEGSAAPGYWGRYSVPPAYARVVALVGTIPQGATLVASSDLFPFVANDVNAYSTLWYPADPPNLPFNMTNLPRYVLVSQVMSMDVPSWLGVLLTGPQFYGERAYLPGSPVGAVVLYEQGYTGNASSYGPGAPPSLSFISAPTHGPLTCAPEAAQEGTCWLAAPRSWATYEKTTPFPSVSTPPKQ